MGTVTLTKNDKYFFLKVIDSSRKKYVRNQRSHKIND